MSGNKMLIRKDSSSNDFLEIVSKTPDALQRAKTELVKYDKHKPLAQAQIGRELVIENSNLKHGMTIMSDVMRELEIENDEVKTKLEATESRLGRSLTTEELNEYR